MMASRVEELNRQKPALEGRIRLLVNNDLKEICKANNQQVSGTKVILQRRVLGGESLLHGGAGSEPGSRSSESAVRVEE